MNFTNSPYELAMRWTKGKRAFFVVSHTDRPHPYVYIYYNSTSLDCTRKCRDFLGSARALRRLSDRVCLEYDLSVIENPNLHSTANGWAGSGLLPARSRYRGSSTVPWRSGQPTLPTSSSGWRRQVSR